MENAIKALETAVATILFAVALALFIDMYSANKEYEKRICKDISKEWLIIEGAITNE